MSYVLSVRPLAHYVVTRCMKQGHPISNLHLQKILHLLQLTYCYKYKGKKLLFPEEFHAWPYGPVMAKVYHEFSRYGGRSIVRNFDDTLACSGDVLSFLNQGVDLLCCKCPWDLVRITHASDSPWNQVYREDTFGRWHKIDNDFIVKWARKKTKRGGGL